MTINRRLQRLRNYPTLEERSVRTLTTREDFEQAAKERDMDGLRDALHAAAAKGKKQVIKMIRAAVDQVDAEENGLTGEATRLAPGEVHAGLHVGTLHDVLLNMKNSKGQTAQDVAWANGNINLARDHLSYDSLLDGRGYTEAFKFQDEHNGDANYTFHW